MSARTAKQQRRLEAALLAEMKERGITQRLAAAQGALAGPQVQRVIADRLDGRDVTSCITEVRTITLEALTGAGLDLTGVDLQVRFIKDRRARMPDPAPRPWWADQAPAILQLAALPATEPGPAPGTGGRLSFQVLPDATAMAALRREVEARLFPRHQPHA